MSIFNFGRNPTIKTEINVMGINKYLQDNERNAMIERVAKNGGPVFKAVDTNTKDWIILTDDELAKLEAKTNTWLEKKRAALIERLL